MTTGSESLRQRMRHREIPNAPHQAPWLSGNPVQSARCTERAARSRGQYLAMSVAMDTLSVDVNVKVPVKCLNSNFTPSAALRCLYWPVRAHLNVRHV